MLSTILLFSGVVFAGNVADEAEVNFQLGAQAYQDGQYQAALAYFMVSNRLSPNRNVVFNIARCYERLGQYAEAYRWYLEARKGETDAVTIQNIERSLADIRGRVTLFDVQTDPPNAEIYVNRQDLGVVATGSAVLAFPPGDYVIIAEAPGYRPARSETIKGTAGKSTPVTLKLERIVGTVRAVAEPGTTVHVGAPDTAPICTAPCAFALPPGTAVLYFRRPGFRSLPQQIEVLADREVSVTGALLPITGSVVVSTDEPDALVEVDGEPRGYTPTVVSDIPVGTHKITVTLPGYLPVERAVEIEESGQADLRGLVLVPSTEVTAASKNPEQAEDAPSSVSILSSQELRAFAYPTLHEALRGVRGVAISENGIYSSISIRGLGQANDFGNRLLVLQDGAMLNDTILYQSFAGYDGRVDLGDIDRIELVRGPGSVLYGTGAVSGVVNLVTRPHESPTEVHVATGVVDDNVARGRVGFHLGDGNRGIWASVAAARSDGRPETLDLRGGPTAEVDGVERFGAGTTTGNAWVGPVTAQWFYTRRRQFIPTGAYGFYVGSQRPSYTDTRGLFELRYAPKFSEKLSMAARLHGDLYTYDGTFDYGGGAVYLERYSSTSGGAELRFLYTPTTALKLTLGGEYIQAPDTNMLGWDPLPNGGKSYYLNDGPYPYNISAAYALVDADPTTWLKLSAGARLDAWSTFGTAISPRLAAILKPTPVDILKIMGGRAFRAPSMFELYYDDGGFAFKRPDSLGINLQPEQVWLAEAEYTRKLNRYWSVLLDAHSSYDTNVISSVAADPEVAAGPTTYDNSDTPIRVLGADVELRRSFVEGRMVTLTYGYLDARYLDADQTWIPNQPHHFASFKGVLPVRSPTFTLATRLTLEAPRRINLLSDAVTDPAIVTDVVASGSNANSSLRYSVGVYNLFDWDYAMPVPDSFAVATMPQQGRSFQAQLTWTPDLTQ